MYVNNPKQTFCLVDLMNLYDANFNYEDLYKIVAEWLKSEKQYFCVNDEKLWQDFIERFCDRFYSRNFNFYTTLEFKLKLRDCLRSYKDRMYRIYEVNALKINPLCTFKNTRKTTTEGSSSSNNSSNSSGESTNTAVGTADNNSTSNSSGTTENNNYSLHSDTPSNAVNINDLFSVAKNYVTDANNNKNSSSDINSSSGSTHSSTNSSNKNVNSNISKSNTELKNSNVYEELAEGYNGEPVKLIQDYMQLTTDIVNYYLDAIENAHLFSNILY